MVSIQDCAILKKAGPLRNGAERGKGSIFHAVPGGAGGDTRPALCNQSPAIMWSYEEGGVVTCPRCIRILLRDADVEG